MDQMRTYEVNDYLRSMKYIDKTLRELERYSNYVYLQSNTKKELKPSDILKLPWDEDEFRDKPEYSEEEAKELENKASRLKQMLATCIIETEKANLI